MAARGEHCLVPTQGERSHCDHQVVEAASGVQIRFDTS